MLKIKRTSVWLPDYVADSVLEINAAELKKAGITHLVFDLDNTLLVHRTNVLSKETIACIANLRREGFSVILGSNTRRNTDRIVRAMGARVVRPQGVSYKPNKSFYIKIIAEAGVSSTQIAMIGDHIINDIIGANRAGMTTILVKSLSRRQLTFNTAYIRWLYTYASRH